MALYIRNVVKLRECRKFPLHIKNKFSHDRPQVKRSPNVFFGKYLFWTNTVSSGIMMFVGDLIQQEVEFRTGKIKERYDFERLKKMTIVGFAGGPLHHWYYGYLEVLLPGSTLKTVAYKMLADQLVASPLFISFFFYGTGLQENKSLAGCTAELKEKGLTVYLADWIVWPPNQFINFYYIKVQYRVLYINAVTTVYDVFLSFIKHIKKE